MEGGGHRGRLIARLLHVALVDEHAVRNVWRQPPVVLHLQHNLNRAEGGSVCAQGPGMDNQCLLRCVRHEARIVPPQRMRASSRIIRSNRSPASDTESSSLSSSSSSCTAAEASVVPPAALRCSTVRSRSARNIAMAR
jgi:hypothetical protein